MRFLNDYAARVHTTDHSGDTIIQSTFPLRSRGADGRLSALDLRLIQTGQQLSPNSAPIPFSVTADTPGGATLSQTGVGLAAASAVGRASLVNGSAAWPNALVDTDLFVRAVPRGFEADAVLRSDQAPEVISYRLRLPAGATASEDVTSGAVTIESGARPIAAVSPPVAYDQDGTSVPVDQRLTGNTLIVTVRHHDSDVHYPITVDPQVFDIYNWNCNDPNRPAGGSAPCDVNIASWQSGESNPAFAPWQGCAPSWLGCGLWLRDLSSDYYAGNDYGWYYYSVPGNQSEAQITYFTAGGVLDGEGYNPDMCFAWGIAMTGYWSAGPNISCIGPGAMNSAVSSTTGLRAYWEVIARDAGSRNPWAAALQWAEVGVTDSTAPTFASSSAPTGWTRDRSAPIHATFNDSGVGVAEVDLSAPGTTNWTGGGATSGSCPHTFCSSQGTGNGTVGNLSDGHDTVYAAARDAAGNTSPSTPIAVNVDTTPPSVSASGPLWDSRNSYVGGAGVTVQASASDATSGVDHVDFLVDGVSAAPSATCSQQPCTPSFTLDSSSYSLGPHTITLRATDAAGNTADLTWTVKNDPAEPVVDLTGTLPDVDGQIVSGSSYSLGVTATDGAADDDESGVVSIDINVDGQPVSGYPVTQACSSGDCEMDTASDWQFVPTEYSQGLHQIDVLVRDAVGNVDDETIGVNVKWPQQTDSQQGSSARYLQLNGASSGDRTGTQMADVGDLNGDGYDDYVVSAPESSFNGTKSGVVYVVYGSDLSGSVPIWDGNSPASVAIYGGGANQYCGSAVAGIGDFNGDGFPDIAVGCPGTDGTSVLGSVQGHIWIVPGGAALPRDINLGTYGPAIDITGPLVAPTSGTPGFGTIPSVGDVIGSARTGTYMTSGDVNGDGLNDLVIGDPSEGNNLRPNSGSAFVVLGRATPGSIDLSNLGTGGYRIDGAAAGDIAGSAVAIPGDINGDGYADVVVGAPYSGSGGRAYVIFGSSTLPSSVDLASLGSAGFPIQGIGSEHLGSSVASLGDIDSDGLADWAIGATDGAYVLYGESGTTSLSLSGVYPGFRIDAAGDGPAVVGAGGDLNDDGVGDVLVGFPQAAGGDGVADAVYAPEQPVAAIDLNSLPGQDGSELVGQTATGNFGAALLGLDSGPGGNPAFLVSEPTAGNGTVYEYRSSTLAGSSNPAVAASSSSTSTGCWGHPDEAKPYSAPENLPYCRLTELRHDDRAPSVHRGEKGIRSHYVFRKLAFDANVQVPVYDSFGVTIASIQETKTRNWNVYAPGDDTQPLNKSPVAASLLVQGRGCMLHGSQESSDVMTYAMVVLEPRTQQGGLDLGVRGFIYQGHLHNIQANANSSANSSNPDAIDDYQTRCGPGSIYRSAQAGASAVTKANSIFDPVTDMYQGSKPKKCFDPTTGGYHDYLWPTCGLLYRPYSRPLLNTAKGGQNLPPDDKVLVLSSATTGVVNGGVVMGVIRTDLNGPIQVDKMHYVDDNVTCQHAPVAQWYRVMVKAGTRSMVGWYPQVVGGQPVRTC